MESNVIYRTAGMSISTCTYFGPIYNKKGENINPDRNTTTFNYTCTECKNLFIIIGNYTDGFYYDIPIGDEKEYEFIKMENKYFRPDIEDIRIGYECELEDVMPSKDPYTKHIMTNYDTREVKKLLAENAIRTPYLTKEQLETEGWECTDKINNHFIKHNYIMIFYAESHRIQIADTNSSYGNQVKFTGSCPSINEFRTISKLLKYDSIIQKGL